jgi:hypothetical protein
MARAPAVADLEHHLTGYPALNSAGYQTPLWKLAASMRLRRLTPAEGARRRGMPLSDSTRTPKQKPATSHCTC